jgi:hypothetical protein
VAMVARNSSRKTSSSASAAERRGFGRLMGMLKAELNPALGKSLRAIVLLRMEQISWKRKTRRTNPAGEGTT